MKCLNETNLHAYLDGELNTELAAHTATHLALCATCAEAARELEREVNLINVLLASDTANDAANIPTQRLKARLDASINQPAQVHQPRVYAPLINGFREFFNHASPSSKAMTTFASVLIIISGLTVLSAMFYSRETTSLPTAQRQSGEVKSTPDTHNQPAAPPVKDVDKFNASSTEVDAKTSDTSTAMKPRKVNRAIASQTVLQAMRRTSPMTKRTTVERNVTTLETPSLPGEASYLEAIAALSNEVKQSSLDALPPVAQADYLQNLKVVDNAIAETRLAARRDPADTEAAAYLRAAYQTKLDFLSSINTHAQIAGLKR
ncbi:MAG: hypothetical protein MSG64_16895 [Pyrinomonadaceae bacterium MAG19_C2-C3]|nr:hypothetical protein [Pyrinomonadaceae bacterium MAG19_C2-C3]